VGFPLPAPPPSLLGFEDDANLLLSLSLSAVRKQIQHMIKYRYVPFSIGKARYTKNSA